MILYIPLLENRQAVSFRIFLMLSIDFQKNHHKIPILSMLCTLFLEGLYSQLEKTVGGFPIEIKTKIRYHMICCYHNFTL